MSAAVRARGLYRTYGQGNNAFHAVRGIDLEVGEGEVVALLDTNGAGKTSTLDLLEGLARPDEGEVEIFGFDPHRDRAHVRRQVGIMLQSNGLPSAPFMPAGGTSIRNSPPRRSVRATVRSPLARPTSSSSPPTVPGSMRSRPARICRPA